MTGGTPPRPTRHDIKVLQDLIGAVWLHMSSERWVVTQLTTPQKDLWADAVDAWHLRLHHTDSEPGEPPRPYDRWWRNDHPTGTTTPPTSPPPPTTRDSSMATANPTETILASALLAADRQLGLNDPMRSALHAQINADCGADGLNPRDIAIAVLTTRITGTDAPTPDALGAVVALARDYGNEGLLDAVIGNLGAQAITAVRGAARHITP
ncbi:hypothetical protein DVS28_b0065 (plasmid) [Euzebya pacifica]|uniref:Uncharacterized protein n=1 Tax=Euzebya pacifica TaxID=1608957 RepID=A0A346Y5T8_9ACTN|nr:hypothetical protein DVS28_b0065 [Euzebya pacifica]